jgi:hypothetical protein
VLEISERTVRRAWEKARLLLAHHATAYDPATFNCATFAAEWLLRATGESIALPAVADEASASAAIAERGGLIAAVSAVLGDPMEDVRQAHRGDIGVTDSTVQGEALCVVVGPTVAAPGRTGLVYLRRSRLVAAWRV